MLQPLCFFILMLPTVLSLSSFSTWMMFNDEQPADFQHSSDPNNFEGADSFDQTPGTWCRGGRGRILHGYQSDAATCAAICRRESSCFGFNLRGIDGICAAYTNGCKEDSNAEWVLFKKKKAPAKTTEPPLIVVGEVAETTQATTPSSTVTEQAKKAELLWTIAAVDPSTAKLVKEEASTLGGFETTSTEMQTTSIKSETIPADLSTTAESITSTMFLVDAEMPVRKHDEPIMPEYTEETTQSPTVSAVEMIPETTATAPFVVPSMGKQLSKVDQVETVSTDVDESTSGNYYNQLSGNCRGGDIVKGFNDFTLQQCADACSSHCACVGFTHAADTGHCVLKASPCHDPSIHSENVNYYRHVYRHPRQSASEILSGHVSRYAKPQQRYRL